MSQKEMDRFAKRIGYWAFNRWCRNQGLPLDTALAVTRRASLL